MKIFVVLIGFPGEDITQVAGIRFDLEKAKMLAERNLGIIFTDAEIVEFEGEEQVGYYWLELNNKWEKQ